MAGSKRAKIKKAFSPNNSNTSSPSPPTVDEDGDLMDELFAHLDSRDQTVQAQSAAVIKEIQYTEEQTIEKGRRSKDRFKERQARKAAALESAAPVGDPAATERFEREAEEEEASITKTCDDLKVEMFEINPDGHCLFSAIADQLAFHNIIPVAEATYPAIRSVAAQYIYEHPDDFLPFLPSIGGEDGAGAGDAGLMDTMQFEQYCVAIRDTGIWGGEPEIQALCEAFNVPIHVIQGGVPPVVFHNPPGNPTDDMYSPRALRISYHRRMYGLGEHYNSLRPKTGVMNTIQNAIHS